MRVKIDQARLQILMKQKNVLTLKQLAVECGIKPNTLYQANARDSFTCETLWLISDRLGCAINDFVWIDWNA